MRKSWQRIEAILRRTAPNLRAALPRGASPAALASAEKQLGFTLPDDIRASYAIHDGSGGADILPQSAYSEVIGVAHLPLNEVTRDWQMWLESHERGFDDSRAHPKGPIKAKWWNPRWVPVTWDGGGDHLCLDLDPGIGGTVGQVICFSHEIGPVYVVAESWRAFLEGYAADLEAGRLQFNADGELIAAH